LDLNNCKKGKLEDDNAIGIFHICFEDFIKYFSSVTICLVNSKFHKETISAKLNYDDCILDAFDLFVTKKKEFYISIFQVVEHRKEYLRRDLIFYVLKMNNMSIYHESKLVFDRSLSDTMTLEAGRYLIVPMSFNHWDTHKKCFSYNIVVQSESEFKIEKRIMNSNILSDCILKQCLRRGKTNKEIFDNSKKGQLITMSHSTSYNGEINFIVGKNKSPSKYLNINLEIKPEKLKIVAKKIIPKYDEFDRLETEEESNFTSSRNRLTIRDSISPLNLKVLAVVTKHANNLKELYKRKKINLEEWEISVTFEKWEIVQSNLEFTEIPLHQIQDYNSEKLHFEQEIKKLM